MVCYAAVQFMLGSASYFSAHPIAETDLYFVQRLSSLARVIVVGMAALGSGVTGTAAGLTRRPAPRWQQRAALACLPGFPVGSRARLLTRARAGPPRPSRGRPGASGGVTRPPALSSEQPLGAPSPLAADR